MGHAAARAALRFRVAQGWILDETARSSVKILEAVDRVTHTGQAEVALHTRGRHGGPAEGIVVEPSGTVLVLAADMVRGVLHASRVLRARPQWTIQVYTPHGRGPSPLGRCSPSCGTWHRGTPPQTPRRKSPGTSTPGRPTRFSPGAGPGAASQWRPGKRARHFLQTGTVPAAPPDSGWRWDAGGAQQLPDPGVLLLWYLPMGTLAHVAQAVKRAFPQPLLPGVALLRSLQAGAAWVRWRKEGGHPSPYFSLVQGQALLHA